MAAGLVKQVFKMAYSIAHPSCRSTRKHIQKKCLVTYVEGHKSVAMLLFAMPKKYNFKTCEISLRTHQDSGN